MLPHSTLSCVGGVTESPDTGTIICFWNSRSFTNFYVNRCAWQLARRYRLRLWRYRESDTVTETLEATGTPAADRVSSIGQDSIDKPDTNQKSTDGTFRAWGHTGTPAGGYELKLGIKIGHTCRVPDGGHYYLQQIQSSFARPKHALHAPSYNYAERTSKT